MPWPRTVPRIVAAAIAALAVQMCGQPATQPLPTTIRIATGLAGMTFRPLGDELAVAFKRLLPEVTFEVVETEGSVRNLHKLQTGEAELGLALADVAYTAYHGRGQEFPLPARDVRAIAVLHSSAVHILVPSDANIRSIGDLSGRIGVGPSGSGTAVTSSLLLNAFGIAADRLLSEAPFMSAADALGQRRIDAAFIVAAYPVDAVTRATAAGARLVNISSEEVERLRSDYPFLRPGRIPAGTYPSQAHDVDTMLVDVLLLTRSELDDELVRQLTGALFEVLPELAARQNFLHRMNPQRAPATPIPLHAGAALFYRERELSR